MKKYVSLLLGVLCLGIGVFLACGLGSITENYGWDLGYMVSAFLVGLLRTYTGIKEVRK